MNFADEVGVYILQFDLTFTKKYPMLQGFFFGLFLIV
jgi:hypothetical protein